MEKNKFIFNDIEQLRGFACILILIQHIAWICPIDFIKQILSFDFLFGSDVVHIFFAISGFVVTFSLKDKLEQFNQDTFLERFTAAKNTLSDFYKRRFYRLVPVLLVVFCMVGLFLALTEKNSNWCVAFFKFPIELICGIIPNSISLFDVKERIYFAGLGPLWTLSVECYFYMLWPICLLVLKNNNLRAIASLLLGIVFLFIINPYASYVYGPSYYGIYINIAPLFLGSFLAFVHSGEKSITQAKYTTKIITFFIALSIWYYPSAVDKVYYYKMTPIIGSVFLVSFAVFVRSSFDFPVLRNLFSFLAKRSYTFYMIQLSLANYVVSFTNSIYFPKEKFSEYDFLMYQFIIYFIVLLLITELVFRLVEKPCRKIMIK